VERVGQRVNVLAALEDGRVVAVEQGNLLGTSFHPEMTEDHRFHAYFLERVRSAL
jgi:5'-phosphate synthase pdxT subunit